MIGDSLRLLRREPRFAIVAVLILAVGIGACTAMFSIVHAVLLRPMALPHAARVVMLWSIDVRHDAVIESIGLQPFIIPPNAFCNYYKYIAFLPDGVDRA